MQKQRSAVVAFGFGEPSSSNPNLRIAETAVRLTHNAGAPLIFTDRDVSPHLLRAEVMVVEIDPEHVPTTYRLAVLAVEGAKKYRLKELHVVAARCHLWRCLRDLRWAACDCDVVVTLTPQAIEGYQYDSSATTHFTRAAWRWWPFEIAYRILSTLSPNWYKRTRT